MAGALLLAGLAAGFPASAWVRATVASAGAGALRGVGGGAELPAGSCVIESGLEDHLMPPSSGLAVGFCIMQNDDYRHSAM